MHCLSTYLSTLWMSSLVNSRIGASSRPYSTTWASPDMRRFVRQVLRQRSSESLWLSATSSSSYLDLVLLYSSKLSLSRVGALEMGGTQRVAPAQLWEPQPRRRGRGARGRLQLLEALVVKHFAFFVGHVEAPTAWRRKKFLIFEFWSV